MSQILGAGLVSTALLAGGILFQQGQALPGPGSGVVQVAGTVNVANPLTVSIEKPVAATQSGEWRMAIANVPSVTLASLPFVRQDGRYEVTWASGEKEEVIVTGIATGGWVSVRSEGRIRWINLTVARAVHELS